MDHYLHYVAASDDEDCTCRPPQPPCARRCESRKHIIPLLDCALPLLDEGSNTPFAEHETRRDKMIFSRKRIQLHFAKPHVINELLDCRCHSCNQARERESPSALDAEKRPGLIESSQNGQILFALMVYLRKFHFVYAWFVSGYRENDLGHAISQLYQNGAFNFTNETEKRLFRGACDQAWEMLNPVQLSVSVSEMPMKYADSQRFPFDAEDQILGGSFGTLRKFEMVQEYCDPFIEALMREYDRSVVGHGTERKVRTHIVAEQPVRLLTCLFDAASVRKKVRQDLRQISSRPRRTGNASYGI